MDGEAEERDREREREREGQRGRGKTRAEKKRGGEGGRKPLTVPSGATLTPTRRLSNLYLPSDQNDQTQTNPLQSRQPIIRRRGFDVFRFPDLFAGGTFPAAADAQIGRSKSPPALAARASPRRENFRVAVKSRRRIIAAGNTPPRPGDPRRGKY